MSKRGRGDDLTGGTRDVNPQYMTLNLTTSAANTFTEIQFGIPVPRFPEKGKKAIVFEMLKIFFFMPIWDANPAAGGSNGVADVQVGTISQTACNPASARTIAFAEREYRGAFTAAGSELCVINDPWVYDLTDGAGHGYLIATDNIFFDVVTSGYTGVASFTAKVLYRFKEVALEEYIGIVQSQQ